jgi:hypothetical protein
MAAAVVRLVLRRGLLMAAQAVQVVALSLQIAAQVRPDLVCLAKATVAVQHLSIALIRLVVVALALLAEPTLLVRQASVVLVCNRQFLVRQSITLAEVVAARISAQVVQAAMEAAAQVQIPAAEWAAMELPTLVVVVVVRVVKVVARLAATAAAALSSFAIPTHSAIQSQRLALCRL